MSQHATYVGGKWYSQWIIDIEQKKWGDKFPCILAMPHFSSSIEYFS